MTTSLQLVPLRNGFSVPYAAGLAVVQRLRDLQEENRAGFAAVVAACENKKLCGGAIVLTPEWFRVLESNGWLAGKNKKAPAKISQILAIIACTVEDGEIVNPFRTEEPVNEPQRKWSALPPDILARRAEPHALRTTFPASGGDVKLGERRRRVSPEQAQRKRKGKR